jgi:hypothetical protein
VVQCGGYAEVLKECATCIHGCQQGAGQTRYLPSLILLEMEIKIGRKKETYQILITKIITVFLKNALFHLKYCRAISECNFKTVSE